MARLRLVSAMLVAIVAAIAITVGASAAPKFGCPNDGWTETSSNDMAAAIYPTLLDPSPWQDADAFREDQLVPLDKNGDEMLCLKQMWGESLNPNSHWYKVGVDILGSPTVLSMGRDNNANASNN